MLYLRLIGPAHLIQYFEHLDELMRMSRKERKTGNNRRTQSDKKNNKKLRYILHIIYFGDNYRPQKKLFY